MTPKKHSLTSKMSKFKQFLPLYLMMVPALIYLFINNYLPMGGLVLAFKKYTVQGGIWGSEWNGLKNFAFLTRSNDVPIIVRNTLLYNFTFIILNVVVGVILAIFITEISNKKLQKFAQSSVLFPFVVSIIIVSYMVRAFLDSEAGLFNSLLEFFGLQKISWYDTAKPWPYILVFVNLWKGVGYSCILYISTILGIDPSLYEAARLAGASKGQQIRYITLPFLKPTVITMVLLNVGRIFSSDFGLFYQVPQNSGLIMNATQTVDTFVYRALMTQNNIGMSSAASFLQSVIGLSMILIFNGIARKVSRENALF